MSESERGIGEMEEETPKHAADSTAEEAHIALSQHANAPTDPMETPNGAEPRLSASSSVHRDIFKALEVVERDSVAIAESFTSLFSSLSLALSEVTSTSVEHMRCFNDAAGRLQESALDAASKGNRYLNSCLRLNQEMKGIESLAMQLKLLRRNVDALDAAVSRIVKLP